MAYPDITSGEVMDKSAALMNDAAKSIYTYTLQLPYLNMALQSLQEVFELNNIPVTDTFTSTPIDVPAGDSEIGFEPDVPVPGTPYLPDDLVEPKVMWVSNSGQNQYVPITRVDFLPRYDEDVEISQIVQYVWQSQLIKFLPANSDNDVKLDYIRYLFAQFTDVTGDDTISIINSASYLEFKTAAYLAMFCAENPTRAQALDSEATGALDRVLGIGTKGRQRINIRHRPFRSSYKRRVYT